MACTSSKPPEAEPAPKPKSSFKRYVARLHPDYDMAIIDGDAREAGEGDKVVAEWGYKKE